MYAFNLQGRHPDSFITSANVRFIAGFQDLGNIYHRKIVDWSVTDNTLIVGELDDAYFTPELCAMLLSKYEKGRFSSIVSCGVPSSYLRYFKEPYNSRHASFLEALLLRFQPETWVSPKASNLAPQVHRLTSFVCIDPFSVISF